MPRALTQPFVLLAAVVCVALSAACPSDPPEPEPGEPAVAPEPDPQPTADGGEPDVPPADAGEPDVPPADAGEPDVPPADAGEPDVPPADAGEPDVPPADAGAPDGGVDDDAGTPADGGVLGEVHVCDVVEQVFEPRCISCHDGSYQFDLREDAAKTLLVNQPSAIVDGAVLVAPGDLDGSFLWTKVAHLQGVDEGGDMPPGSMLDGDALDLVSAWISQGASVDCGEVAAADPVFLSPEMHLRRVARALTGTWPTQEELDAVAADANALDGLIDDYMSRPAFGETIRDLHNDALLTRTLQGFSSVYPAIGPLRTLVENDPTYNDIRRINREVTEAPLKVAEVIVASDMPYTTIVTGDFSVGTEATRTIWGDGSDATTTWYTGFDDTGPTGYAFDETVAPYAADPSVTYDLYTYADGRGSGGVIASNAFMARWQSAGSNYGRGRANAISRAFLCYDFLSNPVDVSSGAINLSDPDAVANAVTDPSTSCWGCHQDLDNMAAYTQPFRPVHFPGSVGQDGYPYSMHNEFFDPISGPLGSQSGRAPGYFNASVDEPNPTPIDLNNDGSINMGDLGRHIADDPRFTSCTVKRFFSFFTQRELHDIPTGRQNELEDVLLNSNFSAKQLIKAIMLSDEFRTSHMNTNVGADEANGVLRARPSQTARLVERMMGQTWGAANNFELAFLGGAFGSNFGPELPLQYGFLDYVRDDFIGMRELAGGIDGFTVVRPVRSFTAGTGSASRYIGDNAGLMTVFQDFTRLIGMQDMVLFLPDALTGTEAGTRTQLSHLHLVLFGLPAAPDSPEVDELYTLYSALLEASRAHPDPNSPDGTNVGRTWGNLLSAMMQDIRFNTY